jgi:hypothetical protein
MAVVLDDSMWTGHKAFDENIDGVADRIVVRPSSGRPELEA